MAAVIGRVCRLERSRAAFRYDPGDCPGSPTALVDAGEAMPDDVPRCPLCGAVHVCEVETIVVTAPERPPDR